MRTTITLPDDVHAAVKTLADASGKPISEVVTTLITRGLQREPLVHDDGELPRFAVAADAPMIPGSRAADLLAEDGVE
jgi:hypothetical protein